MRTVLRLDAIIAAFASATSGEAMYVPLVCWASSFADPLLPKSKISALGNILAKATTVELTLSCVNSLPLNRGGITRAGPVNIMRKKRMIEG